MKKFVLFSLVFMFSAPNVYALNLSEKKALASWKGKVAESHYLDQFKENCGYDVNLDMSEDLVAPFMAAKAHAGVYCVEAVNAMQYMCKDTLAKEAISGAIKGVSCEYSDAEDSSFSISEEGVLTFKTKPDSANLRDKTIEFLNNNL